MIRVKVAYVSKFKPLVGEYAFLLTTFNCYSAHVAFGGSSGIRSTARLELPFTCNFYANANYKLGKCDTSKVIRLPLHLVVAVG